MFWGVLGCSGMFRNVPECSGMFHVPSFIDAHIAVITVPLFFSLPLKPPPAPKVVLTLMQDGSP